MKRTYGVAIGLLVLGLMACRTTPKRLDNIPLTWKPTSQVKVSTETLKNVIDTKMQFEVFKDVREHRELIAENREDATPKPVTTRDDVGEFVSTHVRIAFGRIGFPTVDSGGDVILAGEVREFFVEEVNTYKGKVLLRVTLQSRGGKTLWTGTALGTASRFGRSYSANNYYEVLSDAIVNSVSALLEDPKFRAALAGKS